LIDPYSIEAIRDGLVRLLRNESLRTTLIAAGVAQAQPFTWERAARQLRQVYAALL